MSARASSHGRAGAVRDFCSNRIRKISEKLLVRIGESIASRLFLQNGKTEQKKTVCPGRHFIL